MQGVVVPVLDEDDLEVGGVAHDELDVLGDRAATALVHDEGRVGERLEADLGVAVSQLALAWAVDGDVHGLVEHDLLGHGDDRGLGGRTERLRGHAVAGGPGLADALVVHRDGLDGEALALSDGRRQSTGRGDVGAVVETAQAT